MAALLGRDEHGCWTMYPRVPVRRIERRYRPGTLILETDYECDGGKVRLIDFMPFGPEHGSLLADRRGARGERPHIHDRSRALRLRRVPPLDHEGERRRPHDDAPNSLALHTPAPVKVEHDEHDARPSFT